VFCKRTHRSLVLVAMILSAASLPACSQQSADGPATVRMLLPEPLAAIAGAVASPIGPGEWSNVSLSEAGTTQLIHSRSGSIARTGPPGAKT